MTDLEWIKQLVLAEQKMEDSGVIDLSVVDAEAHLEEQTIDFLRDIKVGFIEAASAFNQLKGSAVGTLKIYGISNTKADFMLFRNGYKLIFSMKRPGEIEIAQSLLTHHFVGAGEDAGAATGERELIRAHWGAFGELLWHHKNLPVKLDFLIRYFVSRFVRESAK